MKLHPGIWSNDFSDQGFSNPCLKLGMLIPNRIGRATQIWGIAGHQWLFGPVQAVFPRKTMDQRPTPIKLPNREGSIKNKYPGNIVRCSLAARKGRGCPSLSFCTSAASAVRTLQGIFAPISGVSLRIRGCCQASQHGRTTPWV